jgi:hypothetical protein
MSPRVRRVDVWEMRCKFNRGRFWQRALSGELISAVKASGHPAPEKSGQPICTQSQDVYYYDQDHYEVARVHQYVLADNTLGASGLPDPKRLVYKGIEYRLLRGKASDAPPRLPLWLLRIWGPVRCWLLGR